jgi:hypothetical protein
MSVPEIRIYVLLCLMAFTVAATVQMYPLFKMGLVLCGLLAVKHLITGTEQ